MAQSPHVAGRCCSGCHEHRCSVRTPGVVPLSDEPTKAYLVVESWNASWEHVVYAHNYKDAKERVRRGERSYSNEGPADPNGISSVRRYPEEDR